MLLSEIRAEGVAEGEDNLGAAILSEALSVGRAGVGHTRCLRKVGTFPDSTLSPLPRVFFAPPPFCSGDFYSVVKIFPLRVYITALHLGHHFSSPLRLPTRVGKEEAGLCHTVEVHSVKGFLYT